MRKRLPRALRREVVKRAKGFCEYCRSSSEFSDSPFDVEHIVPISLNGKTELANLALSCHGCNLYKSSRTEGFDTVGKQISRLFNPRRDVWEKHFAWAENFTVIIGLTPVGRATVDVLRLNRKGLINRRRVLLILEEHPPE
jgi:5-methylcytosine-specific restriction endonuclease McrA